MTLRSFQEHALLLKQLVEQDKAANGPLIAELKRHAEDAQRLAEKLGRLRSEAQSSLSADKVPDADKKRQATCSVPCGTGSQLRYRLLASNS
jgi:hypothetical protein